RCRYTDLLDGLPGIATNLLADRLRELEGAGLVRRVEAPPPVATTLFELTPRGAELEPVVSALGQWAKPLMTGRHRGDAFRSHCLALPPRLYLTDREPDRAPLRIEVRTGGEPLTVETVGGEVRARPGPATNPDAVITCAPDQAMPVLTGKINLHEARAAGVTFRGDPAALRRLTSGSPAERKGRKDEAPHRRKRARENSDIDRGGTERANGASLSS